MMVPDRTGKYISSFLCTLLKKKAISLFRYSFLGDGNTDPRHGLQKELKSALGVRGSIIVNNQTFEKGVLAELGESFPEYRTWVKQIHDRIVDLYIPFRNFSYYHPLQEGSASIKNILPALTGKSYAGLSIAHSDDASLNYFKMVTGAFSNQETLQARKNLGEYCSLDTQGMIWIVEELDKLCRSY